jgi:hypothetical protein
MEAKDMKSAQTKTKTFLLMNFAPLPVTRSALHPTIARFSRSTPPWQKKYS